MSKQILPGHKNVHKGTRQHFMNKTAFDPNKHLGVNRIDIDVAAATKRCCNRCLKVISWKIQYGKYKPLKDFRKCHLCSEKTVGGAYLTTCDPCAEKHGVCAKCEKNVSAANAEEAAREKALNGGDDEDLLEEGEGEKLGEEAKELRERDRRSATRMLEQGRVRDAKALIARPAPVSAPPVAPVVPRAPVGGLVATPPDGESDQDEII